MKGFLCDLYTQKMMDKVDIMVLTEAGFIIPPVRSEASMPSATLETLDIQVFIKKLPGTFVGSPSDMRTIKYARNPSVSAP